MSSVGDCSTTSGESAAEHVTDPTRESSTARHADPQGSASDGYHPLGTRARYVQDERRRRLKEAMAAALRERELAAQCPFAPAITSDTSAAQGTICSGGSNDEAARRGGGVFDRLAQEAAQRAAKLARLAAQKRQAEAAASDASFRPSINAQHPRYCEERLAALRRVPVEERLLQYGKSVALSVQLRQTLRAMAEGRQGHTHDDKADPAEREAAQRAFAERNARLLQQRLRKRVVAEQEAAKELTFRPTLAAGSVALARAREERQNTTGGTPARDRTTQLYESGLQTLLQQKTQQEQTSASAHHPSTNPRSEDWIVRSGHRRLFAHDFVARQELYQRIKEEHLDLIKAEQDMNASYGSSASAALPPHVSAEMIEEQVHRLYPDPHAASHAQRTGRETDASMGATMSSYSAQCSFRPTLSPGTRYVLRKMPQRERDVVRRLTAAPTNIATGSRGGPAGVKDAAAASEHCGAQPPALSRRENQQQSTSSRSSSSSAAGTNTRVVVEDEEALYRRQAAAARRRELRLQQQRNEQEVQEMLACTFRPRINERGAASARDGATVQRGGATGEQSTVARVAGVTDFLQRQAAARRMQAEAAQRRREMGKGKPVNGPGYTLFTPFHLRTASMHDRWADRPPSRSADEDEEEDEEDAEALRFFASATSRSLATRDDGERAEPRELYSQAAVKPVAMSAFARLAASLHRENNS